MTQFEVEIKESVISKNIIYRFYIEQLEKFERLGIGKKTENNIVVTENLINITKHRLQQLKPFTKKYIRKERSK